MKDRMADLRPTKPKGYVAPRFTTTEIARKFGVSSFVLGAAMRTSTVPVPKVKNIHNNMKYYCLGEMKRWWAIHQALKQEAHNPERKSP